MSTSPGRNERCPCGSGRKFKRCCLQQGLGSEARGSVARISPEALDAELTRLAAMRARWLALFADCLRLAQDRGVHRAAGYATLRAYCREELGLDEETIRELGVLERRDGRDVEFRPQRTCG